MTVVLLALGAAAGLAIIGIGVRFLVTPEAATRDFGVAPGDVRALTAIKGVRDVASGIVALVGWAVGGAAVFGWLLVAAAVTPLGDMAIVLRRGGSRATALGVHGATALALVVVGILLGTS